MAVLDHTPLGLVAAPTSTSAVVGGRRRRQARVVSVTASLLAVLFALFCVALSLGDMRIPILDVVRTLVGAGDPASDFIVRELRLPRAVLAVLTGAAFGLSGIVFQTLVRNPLASPDIIGISFGASAAAVIGIIVLGLGGAAVSLLSFGGALVTALAIYLLSWKNGVTGYRLVLVGIGVGAMLSSVVSYVITRAEITSAAEALVWLTGSLNAASWSAVGVLAVCLLFLVPATLVLGRYLRQLGLGDDAAQALGVPIERARLALMLVGVALAAVATAAAGPVAFVAFVAGPIAKRLVGHVGLALVPAMVVGAVMMLGSDLVAQHALPSTQLPVGVVTGIVGAPYLIWLLVTTNRVGRGG
ncbi:MAG: iron chelate uptake ABC transporter family permease subunit [Nocardioidaceae bacterium]|nr:iron chelate uptake ABC transporter family permease subunit [Nocardioidaceae bacterium]